MDKRLFHLLMEGNLSPPPPIITLSGMSGEVEIKRESNSLVIIVDGLPYQYLQGIVFPNLLLLNCHHLLLRARCKLLRLSLVDCREVSVRPESGVIGELILLRGEYNFLYLHHPIGLINIERAKSTFIDQKTQPLLYLVMGCDGISLFTPLILSHLYSSIFGDQSLIRVGYEGEIERANRPVFLV